MVIYYLTEIQTKIDSTVTKSIYSYEYESEKTAWRKAKASWHKRLGAAMESDIVAKDVVYITNADGIQLLCDKYEMQTETTEE